MIIIMKHCVYDSLYMFIKLYWTCHDKDLWLVELQHVY
jgi:hypothetical protein